MATETTNFGLTKDASTDYYNIDTANSNLDIIDKGLVPYIGTTSGSGNTYAITSGNIKNLTIGLAFSIKFNADSTGECTLNVNSNGAKPIKKANGSNMTSLKASGIYTLRYDGVNFILQGEGASGDAAASDLLSGKTASTDAGDITGTMPNIGPETAEIIDLTVEGAEYTIAKGFHSGLRKIRAKISGLVASVIKSGTKVGGITGTFTSDATAVAGDILSGKTAYKNGSKLTGTMVDRGTVNHSLAINGSFTIPYGKHSGTGKVTQNIPTKGAETITPSTANKTIDSGQYLSGVQTILGDPDLISANILQGKNIFGVIGSLVPGLQFATGVAKSSSGLLKFEVPPNYKTPNEPIPQDMRSIVVSGLTFKPDLIVAFSLSGLNFVVYQYKSTGIATILMSYYRSEYSRYDFSIFNDNGESASTNSSAYVNSTGFRIPVSNFNVDYSWVAIKANLIS